ncbi:hypothetical protein F0U61_41035 [Archangium violaceum]|uniref:hypothetical protein n=1 Tax=Archangium violaceum TaxID=83451 RepID=UPI002B300908|nr:hypothetical protein F0U61_41035 [Archangium violaceum]
MADVITCPTGLTGRVRGMKVREERILADRKLARSGGQMDELLGSCWEETLDPGPYSLSEGGKPDWGKVLQGDRFFALLMVRALTYGPGYAFGVGCRNDACRARIEWELDLTKLPVRQLSEGSRTAFIGGNRFETTLPDSGKQVRFRLLTGEDERKLPALQRAAPDRILSAVLAYRVLDIDGVDAKAKRQFLEDLTLRDADFLVDEFDRVDCGVDTTIEVECPECFTVQDVDLPFDRGFFLPGKERTARRRDRSASSLR